MLELALIPARGGSVGLPGKNIRCLGGVPLIAWTVRAACASRSFKRVIVSTDDKAIAKAARESGAETPFMRPAELAGSTTPSDAVIAHALETLRIEGEFALLQPTSPFRSAAHIAAAARVFAASEAMGLVSVGPGKPFEWLRHVDERGFLLPLTAAKAVARRQDAREVVQPNGAIYMTSAAAFAKCRGLPSDGVLAFPMDRIASLDIDELGDFELAEAIVASGIRRIDR